jgi:CRP-like cAMP-binding protein
LEPYTVQITDRLMRPASFSERTAITQQEYERLRADARRHGQGRVRAECYRAMRSNDLRGTLAKVERPALVIWGAEDNTVPLRDAGVVADEWRNADLRIVPKAGHWPQFETPDTTHRFVAAYLGLPVVTTRLEDSTTPAAQVTAAAAFLAHSDIGAGLTLQQRSRLAAQLRMRSFTPGALISQSDDDSSELVVVQRGSIEIWSKPVADDPNTQMFLANVLPGQITGEIALIDGGLRSAELRAGEDGATVLLLRRDRLVALSVDDPSLGNAVIWNIAAALALRLRLINWQQQMAIEQQRATMGN